MKKLICSACVMIMMSSTPFDANASMAADATLRAANEKAADASSDADAKNAAQVASGAVMRLSSPFCNEVDALIYMLGRKGELPSFIITEHQLKSLIVVAQKRLKQLHMEELSRQLRHVVHSSNRSKDVSAEITKLLDDGADPNDSSRPLAIAAIWKSDFNIVKLLVERGATVDQALVDRTMDTKIKEFLQSKLNPPSPTSE